MVIAVTYPVGETPESIQVQSSDKRIMAALAVLVLTIACLLAGTPVAATATAPTVSLSGRASETSSPYARGMRILSASDSLVLACGGECPGLCPCPIPESKSGSALISNA